MTTRCVLFDFGNVIAFFDHRKACRQLAALSSVSLETDGMYTAIFETSLEADYDTGRISTRQFLDSLRATLTLQATDAEIGRAWSDIYTSNEAMAGTLQALKARGLRLVLASNTNDDRADFVAAGRVLGLTGLVYAPGVDVQAATCY